MQSMAHSMHFGNISRDYLWTELITNKLETFLNFLLKNYLFIFGYSGSWLLCGLFSRSSKWWLLSSCGAQTSHCSGFLLWCMGSGCTNFSSQGMQAQQLWYPGSGAQVQQLWLMGLVTPWHVGSFQIRGQTGVSCIDRWRLHH